MPHVTTTRRRIVRRAATVLSMAVGLPTLLLCGYVGAWLLITWLQIGDEAESYIKPHVPRPVWVPIYDHISAGRPGADLLVRLHCIADPNCD